MKKILGLLVVAAFTACSVYASAVVTVQGKLISITADDYVVDTGAQLYSVSRKAVTKEQAAQMEHTEVQVSITVPMKAIDSVREKKKSS